MKITAFCYPVHNGKLRTCGPNHNQVLLAPYGILSELRRTGVSIEVVSLYEPVHLTLPNGMKILTVEEASDHADVHLHMFRDPTEPEVLHKLDALKLPQKLTLNDATRLHDFSKWKYVPLLQKHGLGPEIAEPPPGVQWEPEPFGTKISTDREWIDTAAFNNNRGQYVERRGLERVVTRFVNNATNGIRSMFRIGYVLGRFSSGWLYMTPASQHVIKTGLAAHAVPFDLPRRHHPLLRSVLEELAVDYCHIEGCFVGDRLHVFDINAHPTSYGATLSVITRDMSLHLHERLKELLNHPNS